MLKDARGTAAKRKDFSQIIGAQELIGTLTLKIVKGVFIRDTDMIGGPMDPYIVIKYQK